MAGWNKPEKDAFGVDLQSDHGERYTRAQEWFDNVQKIWSSDTAFDWEGTYFQGTGVYGNPKPVQSNVPILNAASSKSLSYTHLSLPSIFPVSFSRFSLSRVTLLTTSSHPHFLSFFLLLSFFCVSFFLSLILI